MTRPRRRLRNHRWPACRRPGIIPGRRFALVLVLATVASSGGVAVAEDNASQEVTAIVYARGQSPAPDSVTIGTLEADAGGKCATYSGPDTGFQGPGGDDQLPPTLTWPLSSVLACLTTPVSISDVTGVTVFKQAGSPEAGLFSQLSPSDLKNPSDFPLSAQSPVITSDGSGIIYNRPARSPSDNNAADNVLAPSPTPFLIAVYEGPPLNVVVTASTTQISPGGRVTFGEALSPQNQSGLSYSWNFGGATPNSSSSSTPSARFSAQGSYTVTLEVTDAAGGGGTGTRTIHVGSQRPAFGPGNPRTGGGTSPKSKSPTGPRKSGGAAVGAPAGKSKPNPSGTASSHKHTSGASSQPPVKHSKQTVPKPKGAPHNRAAAPAKLPTPAPASHPALAPLITGRLVSDVRLLPADASPLVQSNEASVATAPPAREAIRASLLPGLAGALSIVLLFTLGAGRELRGRRGWPGWRKRRAGI